MEAGTDADQPGDSPPDDDPAHAGGCQCLACRWADFKPIPVTEGPFAGKAFYFGAAEHVSADAAPVAPSVNEHADKHVVTAAHSPARRKRKLVSSPTRR